MNTINLIIQYYNDTDLERQKEYDECVRKNLNCPYVKSIHNIFEPGSSIPEEFTNHPKHNLIDINLNECGKVPGRLTFQYAFDYANKTFPPGEVVAIINLDTFIDPTCDGWESIKSEFFDINPSLHKVLSLSRYEYYWSGEVKKNSWCFKGNSADAWIVQTPIRSIPDCNFAVGNCPSCDNGINFRFHLAGYRVFNWATKFRICHLDLCRGHVEQKFMVITDKTDHTLPGGKGETGWFCCPYQPWEIYLYSPNDIDGSIETFSRSCKLLYEEHQHIVETSKLNISQEELDELYLAKKKAAKKHSKTKKSRESKLVSKSVSKNGGIKKKSIKSIKNKETVNNYNKRQMRIRLKK